MCELLDEAIQHRHLAEADKGINTISTIHENGTKGFEGNSPHECEKWHITK